MPMSDGGDGLLDVLAGLGGDLRHTDVTGPLGSTVRAPWRRFDGTAVIEMAQASGISLVGGASGNDPLAATTRGTGELIVAALESSPRRVVVGLGGSATTDGGLGAVQVVAQAGGLGGVELVGACDVGAGFVDAARQFARQKGADDDGITELVARLEQVAIDYLRQYGVDVREVPGAGAAGGLGGGILALGGSLTSGFDLVASMLGLERSWEGSQLAVTGEGALDAASFDGKVVGGVVGAASARGLPVVIIAGHADESSIAVASHLGARVVSLTERFGADRACHHTLTCIEMATADTIDAATG